MCSAFWMAIMKCCRIRIMRWKNVLNTTSRIPPRKALKGQVRQMEIKDPTLRKLNLRMLSDIVQRKANDVFRKFTV